MKEKCNKCCCPMETINSYNSLKGNLAREFVEHINAWMEAHPYVTRVSLSRESIFASSSSTLVFDKGAKLEASIDL